MESIKRESFRTSTRVGLPTVKPYERPTDSVWDEFFESDEGVTDDFMEDREQPAKDRE